MSNKKEKNFLVQGSILAIASLIVRVIGLFYRIPMTNILGDEGIGLYSMAFEVYNIGLIVSCYGIPLAVSKLIAARTVKKEYKNVSKVFLVALAFSTICGATMAFLLFFGANFIATRFFATADMALPLKVLAPTILVFAVMGVIRGLFQGENTMIPTAISQVIEQIVNAIFSIAVPAYIVMHYADRKNVAAMSAAGGTCGTFLGALSSLIFLAALFVLYYPVMKRHAKKDTHTETESGKTVFTLLIYTMVPIILSQTVYQISGVLDSMQFQNIMEGLGMELSKRTSLWGIYSSKYRLLTNVPVAIASALASSIIPSIVASRALEKHDVVQEKIASVIKFNMLIAIPSAIGLGVLANPIMRLLFGDGTKITSRCLMLGSIAVVFFSLSTVTNAILQGIDLMRLSVIHSAISLGIHLILVFLMLRVFHMGIYGLVIGNVTFALVVCALNWIVIGKRLEYQQEIRTTFIMPFACAIIMGVAAFVIYHILYWISCSNIYSVLIAIIFGGIVYGISLILLNVVSEEELIEMPMGLRVVRLCKKFELM